MTTKTAPHNKDADEGSAKAKYSDEQDPVLALIGSGSDFWAEEHADDYVGRLREDW